MHPFVRLILFPILFPLSILYRILFFLDRLRTGKNKLPQAFVISVGNFSVGGTGKTPFILHLAKLLTMNFPDFPIVVLSRGYGSSGSGTRRVSIDSEANEVGDEPLLIKKNLPFAEVFVGRSRYESYFEFRKALGIPENRKVFVLLDDGFQHHALERDLDIVLIDSTRLDKKDFVLPLGLLRESFGSVNRADIVVASKFEEKFERPLERWVSKYKPKKILRFYFVPEALHPIVASKIVLSPGSLKNKSVFAFCGLGNPEPFWSSLRKLNLAEFECKAFADHKDYSPEDIIRILELAKGKEYIVCTEKDAVKLVGLIPASESRRWFYLKLATKLEEESVLLESVHALIR
ncbi:tetraacyldisaccharide 4'-kinase [Leptospira wolffii]|uniref:Tetraacyldisaccharide 4'-kinase n=1 Tax=Leptospira wolffii TaxID=409998 RepID=A0A2M9Z9I6_9LEPT|nr:tetraacyldisaccharide 4'-kinase [Leptospira wolffii]PJZ65012.1 tetraacyldisaccharide 4'-kinase [Leptospira wolffii]